jgi:hypothetical protein
MFIKKASAAIEPVSLIASMIAIPQSRLSCIESVDIELVQP